MNLADRYLKLFYLYVYNRQNTLIYFRNIHGAVFLKSDITYHWVDPLWVYNTYIGRFLYLRVFYRQLTFDQRKSITLTLPPIGDFEQLHTWRGHSVFKYVLLMLEKLNFQRRCIIVKWGCMQKIRTVMSIFGRLWRHKGLKQ